MNFSLAVSHYVYYYTQLKGITYMLNEITRGVARKPYLITIFGPPGVGKTTFGCKMPDPIFICVEDGLPENADTENVSSFPKPQSFKEIIARLEWLLTSKHSFKTLCIDSLDHLEPLIHDDICQEYNAKTIEKVDGGYGKGYKIAKDRWRSFFNLINDISTKMHVLLICHSRIKAFSDPSLELNYERHELKLHDIASDLVKENSRALLFMNFKTATVEKGGKVRGFSDGSVKIYTQYRAHHEGKNRYNLPYEINSSYSEFDTLAKMNTRSSDSIKEEIASLKSLVTDQTLLKKIDLAIETAKDSSDYVKILTRLKEITNN